MSSILDKYTWGTGGYQRMTGTEDFITVAELGEGGYDWCQFNAFYSPSARRYFWHGDRGCSCNSWSDDLNGAADFQDGDRDALLRAWEAFAKDNEYSITASDYIAGAGELRTWELTA